MTETLNYQVLSTEELSELAALGNSRFALRAEKCQANFMYVSRVAIGQLRSSSALPPDVQQAWTTAQLDRSQLSAADGRATYTMLDTYVDGLLEELVGGDFTSLDAEAALLQPGILLFV